ncbi:manganese efflux pump MntP [candidate division WOR-3 bacterium]|uniref:Putative manganese efflux pump MntP n=1 Tax=candidate division WOR-3 bacterium TaxID=2052148 RepID=A0A660SLH6_UNCW3|nr:MAG: manganese efflux pump MntP [candidate division WOR-3 bacterium]
MSPIAVVLIALGLAMDCFAVSITSGLTIRSLRLRQAFKIAIFFGLFQALMPVVGWLAGMSLRGFIIGFDHWIAFGLLSLIGGKMIYEAIATKPERNDPFRIEVLLMLSLATSIDALAVGISFAFLGVSIITPVIIIGIVAFVLSFLGSYIGNRIGHLFETRIEIVGGIILILIGVKILIEHLTT